MDEVDITLALRAADDATVGYIEKGGPIESAIDAAVRAAVPVIERLTRDQGAGELIDLGTVAHDNVTFVTVGQDMWSRAKQQPIVGDLLIARVRSAVEWVCPSGWSRTGELASHLIVHPGEGGYTFELVSRASIEVSMLALRRVYG